MNAENTFKKNDDHLNGAPKKEKVSKNSLPEKSNTLMRELEDLGVDLPKMEIEKNEVILETQTNENDDMKIICEAIKDARLDNESLKNATPEEQKHLIELPLERNSTEAKYNDTLFNFKETTEDSDENNILFEKEENELRRMPNEDAAFSTYFDITIPRIGKHVFQNNEKPFTKCYDLAIERNKRRSDFARQTGMDDEVLRLVNKKRKMSEKDKKKDSIKKQRKNIKKATYVTKLNSKILEELRKNNINEKKVIRFLDEFISANVTPTCLLYLPHLVHTICFMRGSRALSKKIRLAADNCYNYCHAMFPVPFGSTFETVYTSEMKKFLPDDFEKMEAFSLDYGDIDDILEGSDSENDVNDSGFGSDSHRL